MAAKYIKRVVPLDGPVIPETLPGSLFTEENRGHVFLIFCVRDARPLPLEGTITAEFLTARGDTVPLDGQIQLGAAVVTLTADCYRAAGRFKFTVFCTRGAETSALYSAEGRISVSSGETLLGGAEALPSLAEIRAAAQEALSAAQQARDAADALGSGGADAERIAALESQVEQLLSRVAYLEGLHSGNSPAAAAFGAAVFGTAVFS